MSKEAKVGLFVLLGIVVLGVLVFLIGDERRMFARKVKLTTAFSDVQGLKIGAPVRMDGIDVGAVTAVEHGSDLNDATIHVEMKIVLSEAERLHADAVARIANKGLLGDKMIEISGGTAGKPKLEGSIKAENPTDFSNLMSQVGPIAEKTNAVLSNLEHFSGSLADEGFRTDIKASTHSVAVILSEVAEGHGYMHRLLSDPAEAERISETFANLQKTSSELSDASQELHGALARVNQGPGLAHDLLYSRDGSESIQKVGNAAQEVATTLRGVREGNGFAKGLLYGGDADQQQIATNLGAVSRDLRDIVAGVKAGRGTVGALLVDPSVYEDIKVLLGNVQRNDVLRALVRYSIKQDEKKPGVAVKDPGGATTR